MIAVLLRLSIHRPILIGNRLLASFFQKSTYVMLRHFVSDFIDELYLSHGCAFMILVMSVILMTFLSAIFGQIVNIGLALTKWSFII